MNPISQSVDGTNYFHVKTLTSYLFTGTDYVLISLHRAAKKETWYQKPLQWTTCATVVSRHVLLIFFANTESLLAGVTGVGLFIISKKLAPQNETMKKYTVISAAHMTNCALYSMGSALMLAVGVKNIFFKPQNESNEQALPLQSNNNFGYHGSSTFSFMLDRLAFGISNTAGLLAAQFTFGIECSQQDTLKSLYNKYIKTETNSLINAIKNDFGTFDIDGFENTVQTKIKEWATGGKANDELLSIVNDFSFSNLININYLRRIPSQLQEIIRVQKEYKGHIGTFSLSNFIPGLKAYQDHLKELVKQTYIDFYEKHYVSLVTPEEPDGRDTLESFMGDTIFSIANYTQLQEIRRGNLCPSHLGMNEEQNKGRSQKIEKAQGVYKTLSADEKMALEQKVLYRDKCTLENLSEARRNVIQQLYRDITELAAPLHQGSLLVDHRVEVNNDLVNTLIAQIQEMIFMQSVNNREALNNFVQVLMTTTKEEKLFQKALDEAQTVIAEKYPTA